MRFVNNESIFNLYPRIRYNNKNAKIDFVCAMLLLSDCCFNYSYISYYIIRTYVYNIIYFVCSVQHRIIRFVQMISGVYIQKQWTQWTACILACTHGDSVAAKLFRQTVGRETKQNKKKKKYEHIIIRESDKYAYTQVDRYIDELIFYYYDIAKQRCNNAYNIIFYIIYDRVLFVLL